MHPVLRTLADKQCGVFTAADAVRVGYSHSEIRALLSGGRWMSLRRGVYVTSDDLRRAEDRGHRHQVDCLAALLSLSRPRTVVSHGSAARLWNLPVPAVATTTLRLTDPDRWRRGEGFLMSRAPLRAGEVWSSGPLRVTSPARTLIDCAREWPVDDAVVAMDAGLLGGQVTTEDLLAGVAAAERWPGAARATRALRLADGRAESPLETRGRLRIIGSGFPTPALQVELHAAGHLVGVVDAWFDEAAVAVEFDGRVKYTDPWRGRSPERVLWEEKRREDELRGLGVRFLRIADADLGTRWPAVEKRLGALLSTPGPAQRLFRAVPRTRGLKRTG